jgi:hypothetical protein
MFGKSPRVENVKLDAAMNRVLDDMDGVDTNDEGYSELLSHLERLSKLRTHERPWRVSPDTVVMVAGNLIGIAIIVSFEQSHALTTKAVGFISKLKTP